MNQGFRDPLKILPWCVSCGRQLALLILPGMMLPVLIGTSTLAAENPTNQAQKSGPASVTAVEPNSGFVVIRADQQSYDRQLGRIVARGNVEAQFNGWLLQADTVELAEQSRSVYASGQVRLSKGDQYLQASRLRYSDLEGTGELDNV